ncbi:MAG: glycosyltransferase family 4 protein [Candidatus Kapaibacteriales bacterium]
MKNVLIVAYYFPPMGLSGVQRTLKFVKYLPQFGWRPIVLTTSDSKFYAYDYSLESDIPEEAAIYQTKPTGLFGKSHSGNEPDGGKGKVSTSKYPSKLKQRVKRIISQTLFQPDSRRLWKKKALETAEKIFKEHDIDLVFASGPPFTSFMVARELSFIYDVPYMLDYRDLWVDNAYYFYATFFHKRYAKNLENLCLQRAEKITVISREMKEALIKRYDEVVGHEEITILPHGFDQEDFEGLMPLKGEKRKFTLTHSGLFPDDLTPKYFLQATAEICEKYPEIKNDLELRFVGLMRKRDLKRIKKLDLEENTIVTGYLPHSEAVTHIMDSSVLWMMLPNNIATPSRLFEYFGSGKPMLISMPQGGLRQIVEESGAAFTTDFDDVESIKAGILHFYELWKKDELPTTPELFRSRFERRKLTEQLSKEMLMALRY